MSGFIPAPQGPATHAFAITPSNATVFATPTSGLWIGGVGDVAVLLVGDTVPVTFTAVAAGTRLPVAAQKVMATNTTATLIVGLV